MADSNTVLRPLPRKPWQITPASTDPPSPSTPSEESAEQDKLSAPLSAANSRSILNLTSSTLFGIYSPQDADGVREAYSQGHTPWGTGTMTPSSPFSPTFIDDRKPPVIEAFEQPETRQRPSHRRPLVSGFLLPLTIRTIVLFISGLAYAVVITHLHDNRHLTPVKMEGLDGHSWKYFVSWGALSAVVGNIFPWLDFMFEGNEHLEAINQEKANGITSGAGKSGDVSDDSNDGVLRADWNPAVRGIGMFIGIAFAIRRLPWESTSQASLTLAMINPALWYLVDRSKAGFIISTVLALLATPALFIVNPDLVPLRTNAADADAATAINRMQAHGFFSSETIGVCTWIASVIFCSCICFRNIGKRLPLAKEGI